MSNNYLWIVKIVSGFVVILAFLLCLQDFVILVNPNSVKGFMNFLFLSGHLAMIIGAASILLEKNWGTGLTICPLFVFLFLGIFNASQCGGRGLETCNPYFIILFSLLFYGLPGFVLFKFSK